MKFERLIVKTSFENFEITKAGDLFKSGLPIGRIKKIDTLKLGRLFNVSLEEGEDIFSIGPVLAFGGKLK